MGFLRFYKLPQASTRANVRSFDLNCFTDMVEKAKKVQRNFKKFACK